MKRVSLLHACLLSAVSLSLLAGTSAPTAAQGTGATRVAPIGQRSKPYLGGALPAAVTRMKVRKGRSLGPSQTVDATPNTPTVSDLSPFWTKDERRVVFQSNRLDMSGSAVNAPATTFHLYQGNPDGGSVVAITGPLAVPPIGANSSQTEAAMNSSSSAVVYVDRGAGGIDIVELNLNSKTTKSLVKSNPQGLAFVDLNHPEYGVAPGQGTAVIFAGKLAGQPFKIYSVDTQTGNVLQLTYGISDDRNPTMSPAGQNTASNFQVIAYDSNRADPLGATVKATRDVWAFSRDVADPSLPSVRITNFAVGAVPSNNIEPAWSTNKIDQVLGSQRFVNGAQLIGFASTRYDTNNDGNANGVNPNGTHDIYWIRAAIGPDPLRPGRFTVLTPETGVNTALKLNVSDPNHFLDDRHPTWPQFVSTYRVSYASNRTAHDQASGISTGPATTTDIMASTLLDLNSPALARWNDLTGEIVNVVPKQAAPGSPVTISVKLADNESGIRDVWASIKNPNSKYQSADGIEHKVFASGNLPLNNTITVLDVPVEYEAQRLFIGADGSDPRVGSYANPVSIASIDDIFAFSGSNSPPDEGWLQLSQDATVPRDPKTGAYTYTGTFTTPSYGSDFFVDVIAYDNAVDPFTGEAANWRIYDNIGGFSTAPFDAAHGILFVSDNALGQKFFRTRFGADELSNVQHTFWGTESWMTEIDVARLPTRYRTNTTIGSLVLVLNSLGVKSYGAQDPNDFWTSLLNFDPLALDGTKTDGIDVPFTQQYDIWRTLARGPLPDAVLDQYKPGLENQPPDTIAGETAPRTVLNAPRCVIWHAPYTGNLFTGPGSITDLQTQTQLSSFLRSGGRLMVNGQDIAWALTLNGTVANSFVTSDLKANFVRDEPSNRFDRLGTVGTFPVNIWYSPAYQFVTSAVYNPITHDPWFAPTYIAPLNHSWPGPPFPPGTTDFISNEANFLVGGPDAGTPRWYGCLGVLYPDVVTSPAGVTVDMAYGGGAGTALQHYESTSTGQRVVYSPMGLEALFPDFFAPPNTTNVQALKNRRAEIMHNAVCWLRTGTATGVVRDLDGAGSPVAGALVRLSFGLDTAGKPITRYTALTESDGSFRVTGIEIKGIYEVSAVKAGFTIQKPTFVRMHGAGQDNVSFRMTKAEPAVLTGRILRVDGVTPIAGATVTAVDNLDAANIVTAVSDIDGNYSIGRVPANTTYTITCAKVGYGESIPVSLQLPNPADPIPGQRDTVVQTAKTYTGFDFQLKAEQGSVTGRVLRNADGTPISGATVTATSGTLSATAITDSNGLYSFDKANTPANGLDPGGWGLVATAPGFAPNAPPVDVTVDSNTGASAADIRLDTIAPGLISGLVTRSNDNSPLTGVLIEVKDSLGNIIDTQTTAAVATDGTGYRSNYKFSNVPAGVTYTVFATRAGFTAVPLSQPAAVASLQETKNVNFKMEPLHTFPAALSLVSAPYDYPGVQVGDLLNIATGDRGTNFVFSAWDVSRYFFYPTHPVASTFRLGRGYFMRHTANIALSTEGALADATRPFSIALNNGWNLIGNPFLFDIDWTRVDVVDGGVEKPHGQAVTDGAISAALYSYVSGSYILDFRLLPWRGYWVRAYRNVVLKVDPINDRIGRAAPVNATSRAVLQGAQGWSVNLRASVGQLRDDDNHFGSAAQAVDGFDAFKSEKPPVFGEQFTRLTFDHTDWGAKSGGYGIDLRSAVAGSKTWNFSVNTSVPNTTATLSWPNVATASKRLDFTLTDLATGEARDLRANSGYNWSTGETAGTRSFKIEVTQADASALRITSVLARPNGNSRSAGVNISYTLSSAADVEVRVVGASGARIRNVSTRASRAAGVQQTTWDERDDKGIAVPAGSYLVEIKAKSKDGKRQVRQVAPLLIIR